jgi:dihydropteroate synthase
MGVVNVTPDSFSDGGRWFDPDVAAAHGLAMTAAGADIVDVGGESTRPRAEPVPVGEEIRRVTPVITKLVAEGVIVSVDTAKVPVAEAAVAAGAEIVNDVTALRSPPMAQFCANTGVGVILMHMQGTPRTMQVSPHYDNVVVDVHRFLEAQVGAAIAAGVGSDRICLDPGIGFGKTVDHNVQLLAGLATLTSGDHPILVGTSRKRFLGAILERAGGTVDVASRDRATAATVVASILAGAAVVRVHDVAAALDAVRVADAIVRVPQP